MRQVPAPILKIFAVVMGSEFGNNMLLPLLSFIFFAENSPLFLGFHSPAQRSMLFGLCLGLYKIGGVAGCSIVSALSDYYGRRFALFSSISGLLIVSCFGAAALWIHSPVLLISGYLIVGLLDNNLANGPAIIGDLSTSDSRNRINHMATIQCVIAIGACLGPIAGGQLANHQLLVPIAYALPFLVAVLIAIFCLITIYFCPETLIRTNTAIDFSIKKMFTDYWTLLRTEHIAWLFFMLILCQMSWSCYYQFIPPALKTIFHFSAEKVGLFVGLIAFWLIIATSIVIRVLLKWFDYPTLMKLAVGSVVIGASMAAFASGHPQLSYGQYFLWLSAIPTAMGDVIFFSIFTGLLSRMLASDQQGKAMGLTRTTATLVWSITAFIGGILIAWRPNGALLFAPMGVLTLLVICFYHQPLSVDIIGEKT